MRQIRDANLSQSIALPVGAASAVTPGIDLEITSRADFMGGELLIEVPALTTAELPDTKTYTYVVEHDTDPAFGTAVSLYGNVAQQLGAGGAGCAALVKRVGLPSDVKRYVRLKPTGVATVDAHTKSAALSLVF
jgi:hypothetical protein